jgi:hypothetical protein
MFAAILSAGLHSPGVSGILTVLGLNNADPGLPRPHLHSGAHRPTPSLSGRAAAPTRPAREIARAFRVPPMLLEATILSSGSASSGKGMWAW